MSSATRRLDATRGTAWWGALFIVLLLLGAGMFTAPSAADPLPAAGKTYQDHGMVILVSQLVELAAAAALLAFSRAWATAAGSARLRVAGAVTAGAAALTSLPPLWLAAVAGHAGEQTVFALLRASDLSDVVLFTSTAWFAATTARTLPGPLALVALATAGLQAGRAVLLLIGSDLLLVTAPVAFLVLVAVVVLRSLRQRRASTRKAGRL